MSAYKELEKLFTKVYHFRHMTSLGFWDTQVMMPPKGAAARGAAVAELESHIHTLLTDPKVAVLLKEALKEDAKQQLKPLQSANLREMKMEWERETLIPDELVQRKAILTNKAQSIWRQSREANDYNMWMPTFAEIVQLAKDIGAALAHKSGKHPYEALLNLYEPGMSLDRLDAIFNDVKSWLPDLIAEVQAKRENNPVKTIEPQGPFPIPAQRELSRYCMELWEFDFEAGRQDVSTHPFCGNVRGDVRVTTKYDEAQFEPGLMALIHETGHAKYEQNCGPLSMATQPVAKYRSLGIHEGQSLFAERMIGRSAAFMEHLMPKMKELFGDQPAFTVENMRRYTQRVKPGLIRIFADELCYTMHVIIRYEIERGLIEGTMTVEDVPAVWNEKMQAYLGLETLGNDKDGCLQDIHWSIGYYGYFPTYALGAMVAAQLMHTVRKELGSDYVNECISSGNLQPLLVKQYEKIWQHGSTYKTEELLTRATGEPLNPIYYRRHLERRYRDNVVW
ncbi:metallocarboxypeptidase [Trypanosoma theileri]|uniref:carboxypeptidase Taq n=1 Tax=Trypanosoma theileri TaxID=67003 RepID=A0A1X0NY67_9TRYP|nr:metallocarboxypeptidase [Trypanosoma theileri]ORC89625.1 metallocarboxypeptidase [Trypanosoma theileri]